jgi:hypothetical protein
MFHTTHLISLEVDVISDSEEVLSQAYSDFTRSGFSLNVGYHQSSDIPSLTNRSGIFVVIPSKIEEFENAVEGLLDIGVKTEQIIAGINPLALVEKLLTKSLKITKFDTKIEISPIGQKTKLTGMIETVLSVGNEYLQLILDREIRFARESSALDVIISTAGITRESIVDRAVTVNTLLNSITSNITLRTRAIRLALFLDIVKFSNPNEIVKNSRHLWLIREDIELASNRKNDSLFPKDSSLPLAVCLAAQEITISNQNQDYTQSIKQKAANLDFATRSALHQAVSIVVKGKDIKNASA